MDIIKNVSGPFWSLVITHQKEEMLHRDGSPIKKHLAILGESCQIRKEPLDTRFRGAIDYQSDRAVRVMLDQKDYGFTETGISHELCRYQELPFGDVCATAKSTGKLQLLRL